MLKFLTRTRPLVGRRFYYHRKGVNWLDPIKQPTITQFLEEINYFQRPKKLVDIGLKEKTQNESRDTYRTKANDFTKSDQVNVDENEIDGILSILGKEADVPPLDFIDTSIESDQMVELAVHAGVYRDLFSTYKPNRDNIHFTQEQADKLKQFVPYYWITDRPHSRVERTKEEPEPLYYFRPCIGIQPRFVNELRENQDIKLKSHLSYHGNIITACEAQNKPSITIDAYFSSLNRDRPDTVSVGDYNNWTPGSIQTVNFTSQFQQYFTVILLNLDSIHQDASMLHWMVTNINPSSGQSSGDETCDFLPVHGIRGFGFSRYVFLVLQHNSKLEKDKLKISGFDPMLRKFNVMDFIEQFNSQKMTPVGLSWFQTSWDESSNAIFHDLFKTKAPEYEYIQPKLEQRPEVGYPGKVPFNIYLDHYRDMKDINEQVLLERLKEVDPFDYKDQYEPPKVPPTAFLEPVKPPDWMQSVRFKKLNKIGLWRGLRPASATIPLNNNVDLDYPIRPIEKPEQNPPDNPNQSLGFRRKRPHKDKPYDKPPNEYQNVFVAHNQDHLTKEVMDMMEKFEKDAKKN